MSDVTSRLAEDVLTLQSAAERLHVDTLDRDCAPVAPAALTAIEHTLRILSRYVPRRGPAAIDGSAGAAWCRGSAMMNSLSRVE